MSKQCRITMSPNPEHIWPQVKHDYDTGFWRMINDFPRTMRNWSFTSKLWIVHPKYISKVINEAQLTFDQVFIIENDIATELPVYARTEEECEPCLESVPIAEPDCPDKQLGLF